MNHGRHGGGGEGGPLVIHVVTRLVIGGPTRPLLEWVSGLARGGYRVLVATGDPGPEEVPAPPRLPGGEFLPTWRVTGLRRPPAPLADLRALVSLSRAFRALRPAIVHTHTAKAGVLGRLAAHLVRPRPLVVHTFHGHSLSREAGGSLAPLWTRIERALGPATDRILAVSPRVAADLRGRLGLPAGPGVVPLPVPVRDPAAQGVPGGAGRRERVALFLGRGVPVKGLDLLARAHARAEARRRPGEHGLRVRVVGPVEDRVRRRLDGLLRAGSIRDRWEFLPPVLDPLPALLEADLLVLPSRSEGTPVSLVEALAVGLPVVASAVGGVPDLLAARWERLAADRWWTGAAPPRGLLLPPGDVAAWAEALRAVARDPEIVPGASSERRRFVAEVFDPAARAADLAAVYRGGPGPGRKAEPGSAATRGRDAPRPVQPARRPQ